MYWCQSELVLADSKWKFYFVPEWDNRVSLWWHNITFRNIAATKVTTKLTTRQPKIHLGYKDWGDKTSQHFYDVGCWCADY